MDSYASMALFTLKQPLAGIRDNLGRTALHHLCAAGAAGAADAAGDGFQRSYCLKGVLKIGGDVNALDQEGRTPMLVECKVLRL